VCSYINYIPEENRDPHKHLFSPNPRWNVSNSLFKQCVGVWRKYLHMVYLLGLFFIILLFFYLKWDEINENDLSEKQYMGKKEEGKEILNISSVSLGRVNNSNKEIENNNDDHDHSGDDNDSVTLSTFTSSSSSYSSNSDFYSSDDYSDKISTKSEDSLASFNNLPDDYLSKSTCCSHRKSISLPSSLFDYASYSKDQNDYI
jgi:cytoskeletal protein RodZ